MGDNQLDLWIGRRQVSDNDEAEFGLALADLLKEGIIEECRDECGNWHYLLKESA